MRRKLVWMGCWVWGLIMIASVGWSMKVIQTQPSTDANFEISLLRAGIRDSVMTIQIVIKNVSSEEREYKFFAKDVYMTDAKAKKKYYLLKDTQGHYIAGPMTNWYQGGLFSVTLAPKAKAIFWGKFPAPPTTTESVDIYIPWALPFEAVRMHR